MPDNVCPLAFKGDHDFAYNYLNTSTQHYDSCYYTQIIVYLDYDGSCFAGTGFAGFEVRGARNSKARGVSSTVCLLSQEA
jgi:hypothetical protein